MTAADTSGLISSIKVESALLPPITINAPLAGGGNPSWFTKWLRPKVSVYSPLSSEPYVVEPYGDPGAEYNIVFPALLFIFLAGCFLLFKVIRK